MALEQQDYPNFGRLSNRFITFEGGEGVGKTTQIKLLASWLEQEGYEVVCTREPGGTKGAEAIRNLLLFEGAGLSWKSQAIGYMAARIDHLENLILPSLKQGKFVLCDRFQDSTLAYQGYGFEGADPKNLSYLKKVLGLCTFEPSMTFLLDMSTEEAVSRRHERDKDNKNKDRYEKENVQFHQRVRTGFLTCFKDNPSRIKLVDAEGSVEEIHNKIVSLLTHAGEL